MAIKPKGYFDYTVYPLEGVWDINDEAKKTFNGQLNKDDLVFKLMIRQPDFVTESFYEEMLAKKNLKRQSKIHKEIYLSDFRKVAPEKLKTVLRFNVE